MNDPIGQAIYDYFVKGKAEDIVIETNYTEDEHLSPAYFFRTPEEMQPLEQKALKLCNGRILDVGAAAGCHALPLQEQGYRITALEKSAPAVEVMRSRGINDAVCDNIFQYHEKEFDTILLLMNGTGIGGTLTGLKDLLLHLRSLLSKNGTILIDSSDISYLFKEDDGSMWIDLANDNYYGEMEYTVSYKHLQTAFKWLFVDYLNLEKVAGEAGLKCKLVEEGLHYDYLAQLRK